MIVVKINAAVDWTGSRGKGGNWVAVCDPLGLTVQSETWATLMEDIAQTMNAMFNDLLESQELAQFLRARGWKPVGRIPSKPAEAIWFDVPFASRPADRDTPVAVH